MKFDPTKKFGTIYGISSNYPGAKYEQNSFVFNAQEKCLNPTKDKESKESNDSELVEKATKDLLDKKSLELGELTTAIVAAQEAVAADGSAVNKTKLTKLTKKHDALVAEIELMGG